MLLAPAISLAHAGILQHGKVQLICHRTANRDMPENTLESLALAARMGCNVVEIDIRKTLDGILVLNHDDFLERLSSGMGTVERTSSDELALLDAGAWMGNVLQACAFRDLKKRCRLPGSMESVFTWISRRRVSLRPCWKYCSGKACWSGWFSAANEDVPSLYPAANQDAVAWVNPGCNATQVAALQRQGKFVVANFSANAHEMDIDSMRAAVAAG